MRPTTLVKLLSTVLLAASAASAGAGELLVSAASSLTNAFKETAQLYEAQYPGSKVSLNFAASGVLLQQIVKGAPVDVFASADQETMDMAQKQGLVAPAERRDFVRNSLVVIVPSDSKFHVKRLDDLGQAAITRVAISNPASVPVGRYAQHALEGAKLWAQVQPKAITTQNVRQSLDYVARGEVDAGFVYNTDAALMKDKVKVAFEVPLDVAVSYPIASVKAGANAAEAKRFVDFMLSAPAQAILGKYGFLKP
ncbi:molybdate ABC transporter substrate-binding protein [Janthinobacterium fluminis]|uniref:Molybdate ABC transporter substrate-binding protein n=1 Tax=Janthinobacterium fluminis TaxID=2987524 RepID=A0ABT5JYS3_9BURK|nr:molybdate ABC transporter substrate-binding protein [Janthinobacterium fluminis]MDC8757882.1 molybdate ABC transporter substrate-binding protein [Janthinobacterium fluminis]